MMLSDLDKLTAVTLTLAGTVLPTLFTNDLTTPVVGVQVTTVAGAVLGTYAAIGYDEESRPRGRLFTLALSTVILASGLVGVAPKWLGWEWTSGGVEGGLALLASVVIYYLLPPAIKRGVELVRSFRFSDLLSFRKGGNITFTPPPDNDPNAAPRGTDESPDK